jgi:phospholipase/carboxylesterase
MSESIVVQQPEAPAAQLMLLFHGVGGHAEEMLPLARVLGAAFPQAFIVSVRAPHASDLGGGFQWFSVQGVSEANRAARIAAVMPGFVATVRHWQGLAQAGVEATALIGFSQGAMMALEATREAAPLAGRVVAIAGRYAELPLEAAPLTTIHLLHGKADPVIAYGHTVAAAERLLALGADVTADVLPFVGHAIAEPLAALVVERLQGYLPQRRWREALRADPGAGDD